LLQAVSKNIGADNLNTLEYTATGMVAAPGQGYVPIPAVRMVETAIANPVVGDMRITHEYVEWKDFGGVKM
jgi:hypothetical protein